MRIIKLFLLFTFVLWADFKLDIPNEIDTEQLQYIVENGWNDENKTLNQFIITYREKSLSCVLEKISKPVRKVEPTQNDVAPTPKILLTVHDYWNLLSYIKYLENMGDSEKSLDIYLQIFYGLNNIEEKSVLSMVFRIEIEKRAVVGLKQGLENNLFSKEQKSILKKKLSDLLLLDTKIFFDALEADRIDIIKLLSADTSFKGEFQKEILAKTNSLIKSYNEAYYAVKTEKGLEEFDKKFKESKENFLKTYNKWQNAKSGNTPPYKVVKLVSGILILEGVRRIDGTKVDLWKSIEINKILLNEL